MNTAPLVVVYPRGQLTPEDKSTMREFGIVPIEADEPRAVQQLHLTEPMVSTNIKGDTIVRAALKVLAARDPQDASGYINGVGRAAHHFVQLLSKGLEDGAASQQQP